MLPEILFTLWTATTGQQMKLRSYAQEREAMELCEAGFTEDDVKLVVAYIKRQIARNESGFNPQSLTWRVNAADRWAKFQERLSLAQESRQRLLGGKPKPQVPVLRNEPTGPTVRLEQPPPAPAKIIDVSAAFRGLADDIAQRRAQG